jgi:hypothetical protein
MVVGGVLHRWSRRLGLRRQVISFGGLVVEAEPRSGRVELQSDFGTIQSPMHLHWRETERSIRSGDRTSREQRCCTTVRTEYCRLVGQGVV